MADYEYDLVVIGGGSGGVRAARTAAKTGARVALAEQSQLGGTCVNVGCVPKKLYSYAAHFAEGFAQSRGYGFSVQSSFDWPTLRDNTSNEIQRLNGIYQRLLDDAGVTLHRGHAYIDGPNKVSVGNTGLTARRILIATGGTPRQLDFEGAELMVDSNQMFSLPALPDRLVVYGGGYIAVEFASIMNALGVDTTLVYRGELFLKGFDQEMREVIRDEVSQRGVKLLFNTSITAIKRQQDALALSLKGHDNIDADLVLGAVGRVPNFDGLGLENVNVERDEAGFIKVNDAYESTEPSILSLGDTIDTPALTPVATSEAMRLVDIHYKGLSPAPIDYANVATAIFSSPNAASVGASEEEARQQYQAIRVYVTRFRPMMHTLADDPGRCMMKLIVDDASDRVVGAQVVGDDAGELMQALAVCVQAGVTKASFDATIGIHPTSAEEIVTLREPTRR